ncbi:hypothetical protein AgCh_007253 [Apium graveolens]
MSITLENLNTPPAIRLRQILTSFSSSATGISCISGEESSRISLGMCSPLREERNGQITAKKRSKIRFFPVEVVRQTNEELRTIKVVPVERFDVGAILSIARRYIFDTKHNILDDNYANQVEKENPRVAYLSYNNSVPITKAHGPVKRAQGVPSIDLEEPRTRDNITTVQVPTLQLHRTPPPSPSKRSLSPGPARRRPRGDLGLSLALEGGANLRPCGVHIRSSSTPRSLKHHLPDAEPETRPGDQRERSGERSGESRGSVFDRIAKNLKKPPEDARDEIKRAALRERIRKEEEAKAQESIERRVREEEAKLKRKAHRIHVSSESEPEKESKQEQMVRVLRDLKRKVEGDMEVGAAATPFTKKLESTPRESGLKHYNFDSFDGLPDLEEHLNYFEQISNIYDYSDLTRCRFFASTLKGGAQKWFSRIPSRSVDSWKDFREIFLKRFRVNRMNELQMCHLETIQQRSKEPLPEFIKRFQEVVNQLSNLEEKEAVNIFQRNLHPISCEGYVKDLIHREPQSLASAYALASKFIKENNFLKSMKMNRRIHDDDESSERRSSSRRDKRYKLDRKDERKPKAKKEPKPEPEWTPLNRPRADILREVKGKPFYYPPKPLLASPENRARDKHCGYHGDHGHTTENCFSLKMFIEDQIKKGNMNQYLQRGSNDKDRSPGRGKNVVNVIFEGTASPPQSPNPENDVMMIQSLDNEPIYFSYFDYEGLDSDHNLALVVTLDVVNNEVKRILVDNGSSTNIVFEHTLNRMELGHLRMDPCLEDPFYGFGNTMIPIRGIIYLPIIFGTAPRQVSHMMKFYVISATSSYNMILGRPTITKLRAIPSTIHLKLKFPTPGGVGE